MPDDNNTTPPAATPIPFESDGVTFGENWRNSLPEDIRAEPVFERFKTFGDMAKSLVHAQRAVGADKVYIPTDPADQAAWDDVFGKLGRPDAPESYTFQPDADLAKQLGMTDDLFNVVRGLAHKANMTDSQFNAFVGPYMDMVKDVQAQRAQAEADALQAAEQSLRKTWGAAYKDRMELVNDHVRNAVTDEEFAHMQEKGYLNDPVMAAYFHRMAAATKEGSMRGNRQTTHTPDEAKQQIVAIMEDKKHPDHAAYFDANHPRHQEVVDRVTKLNQELYASA